MFGTMLRRWRRGAAVLGCALPVTVLGHGGLSMDEDMCKLRVGPYLMHFVGYQPDSVSGPKEFCEDIPDTGRTVVVLDYINEELRDLPTEIRVIRDTGSETNLDAITLLHVPAKVYPAGSLNFELDFAEAGRFVGLVTVMDKEKRVSRFPFSVGTTRSWWYLVVPTVVAIAGAVLLYRFAVRRRTEAAPPGSAAGGG